ncbi:MAG TPA: SAM-dependent methyltransferase [Actinophytocola sp.]|uniref:SAM-dependent methyltransferase n=1 Tax=Actinophytocola sp. TaxID=1872138 RepID=UPI002DB976CE|nr:SAM-dependent methyltransferase [Actinophytocola sp.]HEU5472695.1 SAM-dependent methyltransferase [Actinophytocola sp.]
MHDYWLGGGHNFAADRELAEKIKVVLPEIEDVVRMNQSFVRRAALFLVEAGIRQFLDITSGLPSTGMVHEVVQRADPDCRVVYVDADPVAVAHNELKLNRLAGTGILQSDLRDIDVILGSEVVTRVLDLSKPVAVMATALHFVPEEWDPAALMARYRDRLASGSYLVVVHVAADCTAPGLPDATAAFHATNYRIHPRTAAEITRICAGFEPVEPGLVGLANWRPERPGDSTGNPDTDSLLYGLVARKP